MGLQEASGGLPHPCVPIGQLSHAFTWGLIGCLSAVLDKPEASHILCPSWPA